VARDLEASLAAVVDLPDGTIELRPDPRPMRSLKLKLGSIAIFNVAFGAGFLVCGPRRQDRPQSGEVAFFPEGIGEFAQRLGVPLRRDFSEKVKDTVDLSKTN